MLETFIKYIQEVTNLNYYQAEDVAYMIMDAVDEMIIEAANNR